MKLLKELKFVIESCLRIIVGFILSLFIWRSKKIAVLGIKHETGVDSKKPKEIFMHNTKYLLLHCIQNNIQDIKLIYLCDDENMRKVFKEYGIKNVYPRNSLKGIYYRLKAKYWLFDYGHRNIGGIIFSFGAILINFWHGTALKKIGFDSQYTPYAKINKIKKIIYKFLYLKENYMIANNDFEQKVYHSAFWVKENHIPILCSPRLDILYRDIQNSTMFIEKVYETIKNLKEQGKNLLIYMPTFRDTGKNISNWLLSNQINDFLQKNNIVLICKLHPADKNFILKEPSDKLYIINGNTDVYPILKYTDALITDYSSVSFDYLLLDKPILYYVPDLEEYQKTCHEFYTPYQDYAVGDIAKNEDELLQAMENVINGIDNYKEKRKMLRDKMFVYQDGKNCERVIDWIKSLNK